MKRRKRVKIFSICIIILSTTTVIGLVNAGKNAAWGPFAIGTEKSKK